MVRIAVCQITPSTNLEDRKAQMQNMLAKAEEERVELICFPEGFLTGYYAEKESAFENSLEAGKTDFNDWLETVKNYSSTIIVGFNERVADQIFDSAAVIENGKLLGIQRKHYLYHPYFTPGTTFSCFQSKGVSFGVIVCLDANYFEPSRLLAMKGATILFCPMCNKVPLHHSYAKRPPYYSHFVARSHENRSWLIAADWIWANDGEMVCPGHSVIYDPDGQEILRSHEGKEQLLVTDIPSERLFHEKGRRVHGSALLAQELAARAS